MADNPTTILQILPSLHSGGVERGTIELSEAVSEAGWKSIVVSSGGPLVANLNYHKAEHITLPVKSKHPLVVIKNIGRLARLIREKNVSLVHARSRAPAWSAYYAALQTNTPFVTTFHGVYGTKGFGKKKYNSIMTKGDRVIAVSEYIFNHITETYGTHPYKIRIIPRGADINHFHPDKVTGARIAELAQQWRINDDHAPIIFIPARITRWKGHEILIRALATLEDKEFLCIMAGNDMEHPDYREEMEALIRTLGLEGKARFAPPTHYMAEAYMLSDLVVAPSIEPEAFGRVPAEAQAMGKIIIAADHGGARETVKDKKTGFLVPPNDHVELAQKIAHVLELPHEMKGIMGKDAMEHIHRHFTAEHMRARTLELYKELL